MNQMKEKLSDLTRKQTVISLISILVIGITLRLSFLPSDFPLTLDSFVYFVYSLAIIEQGPFPTEYLRVNLGWPSFLAIFFSFFNDFNMLELMSLQRIIAISISVATIFPMYRLLRIFFIKKVSLVAVGIFCFEPHLILNSINGGGMPLFVFLVTSSILFIFYQKRNYFIISFVLIALSTFVRYEGLLLVIPLIVSIFLQKKKTVTKIQDIILCFGIFLLVLTPILLINYDMEAIVTGEYQKIGSPILWHFYIGMNFVTTSIHSDNDISTDRFQDIEPDERIPIFLKDLTFGYVKFLFLASFPILLIGMSASVLFISKRLTKNRIIFIIFSSMLSISALYAYGRGIEDSRYLLPIFPIIIVFISVSIRRFMQRKFSNELGIFMIVGVIVISVFYIDYQISDYQEQQEIYTAALFIVNNAEGVNQEPGAKFVKAAEMERNWRELPDYNRNGKIQVETNRIDAEEYDTLESFLKNSQHLDLTHILVYEENNKKFLSEVFHNYNEYSYLNKVYDSSYLDHKKHIKIFEIDFQEFEKENKLEN